MDQYNDVMSCVHTNTQNIEAILPGPQKHNLFENKAVTRPTVAKSREFFFNFVEFT